MKKGYILQSALVIIVLCLIAIFAMLAFNPELHAQTFGAGTVGTLDQLTSTTSPQSAITQRTFGKAFKITGLTTGLCLTLNSSSILTTTACGFGLLSNSLDFCHRWRRFCSQ
jgi:hypothetical protein